MNCFINKLLLGCAIWWMTSATALASSHREAPLIADDPLADNVDLYAFRSPDNPNTITLIATYVPLQLPQGGPNYYSFGENIRYEIHIDNDAAVAGDEITYRFTFKHTNEDPTTFFNIRLGQQNLKTTYTLERSVDGGQTFQVIVQDGVVPRSRLGEALSHIQQLSQRYGLRVANVFHAGDGNLHPLILYDGRQEGALHRAEELAGEILHMCIELDGSITGEHGVGVEKRQYMPDMFDAIDLETMHTIRRQIDPKELANRGKMLPPDHVPGDAPVLTAHEPHPLEKAGIISRE